MNALEKLDPQSLFGNNAGQGSDGDAKLRKEVKVLGRRAALACNELCEKGRCQQLWEKFADFVFRVTKNKIESLIKKAEAERQNKSQNQVSSLIAAGEEMADEEPQGDEPTKLLFEMTDLWHYLCQLSHKLQQNFQSVELYVQRMVRLRAQIRTENVGLKRSHLEMIDENMYDAGASKALDGNQ